VPASTSNLGAGFDCVGLAVDRWLTVAVAVDDDDESRGGAVIDRSGTLADLTVDPDDDYIVAGFRAACRAVGHPVPRGLHIRAYSDIPVARGLGSSGAAFVAGAAAANTLLDFELDDRALVGIASALEGHPDNAAAAVYGGAVLVLQPGEESGADPVVHELPVHPSLTFVLAVPDFAVETRHARKVLPSTISHRVAARAVARGVALVQGLAAGNSDLLRVGLDDVLHVPFRRSLVAGYDAVTHAALQAGACGATLSGSGSSIVAVTPGPRATAVAEAMAAAWTALGVRAACFTNPARVARYAATLDAPLSV
jgi:homoserine kinase